MSKPWSIGTQDEPPAVTDTLPSTYLARLSVLSSGMALPTSDAASADGNTSLAVTRFSSSSQVE